MVKATGSNVDVSMLVMWCSHYKINMCCAFLSHISCGLFIDLALNFNNISSLMRSGRIEACSNPNSA